MKKVKLIIGTVNNGSASFTEEKLNQVYENSYLPFLKLIHDCKIPVTMYYSGELMSWIIDKHAGMQMLFNDLFRERKIEILGGGYYSPLFSLIPRKDKVGQIELMTTELRRRFGKRPRGMWITEKVWEPSMPMTMNYAGMEYTFLDEEFFEDAGLFNGELYQPCMTEDQGKKIIVIPLSNRILSQFPISTPEEIVSSILECRSEKEERIVSFLLRGEDLDFLKGAGDKIRRIFELIGQNSRKIDVQLPGKITRSLGPLKKVYFGCVSPGDVGRWSGPVYRDRLDYEEGWSDKYEDTSLAINPVNNQSFFRHFLAKYPESNNLYSRMINIHYLISQLRGDKQRKKSAENELWKSQNHIAYWHGGGDPGIYSSDARAKAYTALIEADKYSRERGVFKTSLVKDDFDLDGVEELIYRGPGMNAFIHLNGGMIFELDYLRVSYNYVDTMARHHEWYHSADEVKDWYTRNAFVDHFLHPDEKLQNFYEMKYREAGDFLSAPYRIEKYNRDKKTVLLVRNGNISTKKNRFPVILKKEYSFKRNSVIVDYEIINKSEDVLNTVFGTEINLSFGDPYSCGAEFKLLKTDSETVPEGEVFSDSGVTEIQVNDIKRKTGISLNPDIPCSLWAFPVKTRTGTGKEVEELYQSCCFLQKWELTVSPGKSWKNRVQLRLERS